jgi:hypothetical protein
LRSTRSAGRSERVLADGPAPATSALTARTQTHHAIVRAKGTVDAGRRYTISVGNKHAHQPATIVITALSCHVFINARLARHLTLDPTRRKQPLYNRTGRPPATTVREDPRHP